MFATPLTFLLLLALPMSVISLPPSVFIIGSMKSDLTGTTSLSNALGNSSKFCIDDLKEKNFFSFPANYAKGVSWYLKEFPQKCRTKADYLTLDATPSYIDTQNVPKLIGSFYKSQELAQKKFILILRDPVARLYSEYQHWHRNCLSQIFKKPNKAAVALDGLNKCRRVSPSSNSLNATVGNKTKVAEQLLSFSEFLHTPEGKVSVTKGDYHTHIANWLQVVSRDQLFIVGFTPMIQRSAQTLTALSSFLNIPTWTTTNYSLPLPPRKHTNYDSGMRCADRDRLVTRYQAEYKDLAKFINSGSGEKPKSEPRFPAFDQQKELPKCSSSKAM
eukprot:gene27768-36560_t